MIFCSCLLLLPLFCGSYLTDDLAGSSIKAKVLGRQVRFMAENKENKCAHPACDCRTEKDSKYRSEYCKNAEKSGVMEIGCGCEHDGC